MDSITSVDNVFQQLERFHVYDHTLDEWIVSGVDFGDFIVYEHEGKIHRRPSLDELRSDDRQVIWEDGEDDAITEDVIDMEVAQEVSDAVIHDLSTRIDADTDEIRVSTLRAPNVVEYFTI